MWSISDLTDEEVLTVSALIRHKLMEYRTFHGLSGEANRDEYLAVCGASWKVSKEMERRGIRNVEG